MSAFLLSRRRRSQPRQAKISSKWANGLLTYQTGIDKGDYVNNGGTPSIVNTPSGVARNYLGSTAITRSIPSQVNSDYTFVVRVRYQSGAQAGWTGAGAGSGGAYLLYRHSPTQLVMFHNGYAVIGTDPYSSAVGKECTLIGRVSASRGTMDVWCDGQKLATSSAGAATAIDTSIIGGYYLNGSVLLQTYDDVIASPTYSRWLDDAEVVALSENIWQAFAAGGIVDPSVILGGQDAPASWFDDHAVQSSWFDGGLQDLIWFDDHFGVAQKSSVHVLAGANAQQVNQSSTGAVSQTHVLAGANAQQVNQSSTGAVSQTHVLAGANAQQVNESTIGAVSQTHVLAGANAQQVNQSTSGAIELSFSHVLAGANCQQVNQSTSGAVLQTHVLAGAGALQINESSNGAVSQTHVLLGESCQQNNPCSSGAIVLPVKIGQRHEPSRHAANRPAQLSDLSRSAAASASRISSSNSVRHPSSQTNRR